MSLRRIKKPCPGCGEENLYREVDKVCSECARMLSKVKHIEEAEKSSGDLVGVLYGERYHWNKYILTRGDFESDRIMKAFQALAEAASKPSINTYESEDNIILLGKKDYGSSYKRRLMDRKIAEAIRDLHSLIQPLIDSAFESGKSSGHNLLMRLATGDLAPNEFLQKTTVDEEEE